MTSKDEKGEKLESRWKRNATQARTSEDQHATGGPLAFEAAAPTRHRNGPPQHTHVPAFQESDLYNLRKLVDVESQRRDLLNAKSKLLRKLIAVRQERNSTNKELLALDRIQTRLLKLAVRPSIAYILPKSQLEDLIDPDPMWWREKMLLNLKQQAKKMEEDSLNEVLKQTDLRYEELERRKRILERALPEMAEPSK